ncbi:MAG: sulfur oxidation c-type cytochrome SoxX [Betaproteobacteria bacterium]|nr:sulfur oxidation c-type cytochrome SoxX [Betaproteobacteria bacterium]
MSAAQASVAEGRRLFLDPKKGNCAACHQVPGDSEIKSRSKIGPPLVEIGKRFPERNVLRATLWDLGTTVPDTIMPPYGRHRLLTESEIDAVLSYIESL